MAPPRRRQDIGDEELGGFPTGAGGGVTSGKRGPIGVPDDYVALVPRGTKPLPRDPRTGDITATPSEVWGTTSSQRVTPQYLEGDEWKPGQRPPPRIAEIQRRMVEAGLLTGTFRLGVWDQASASAYKEVLAYANAAGLSEELALERMGQGALIDPSGASERAPLVIQRSNPEDLRRVFRAGIIEQLGEGWDRERIDNMVRAYQMIEEQSQREAYDLEVTGGEITAPPTPEAFVEQQATEADPVGVQTQDLISDYIPAFMQLVNSSAWGVG